ncbi:MAG: hypothetical protein ACRDXD_12165 [Acidimicrobiia bacterium]
MVISSLARVEVPAGIWLFGDEFDGRLIDAPKDRPITFVGPDPHRDRRFYGTFEYNADRQQWVVR